MNDIVNQQRDRIAELERKNSELVEQVAEITQYEWREIGSSDWCACDESWFNHCQKDPALDARKQVKSPNQIKAEAGRAGFVTGYSEAQSAHFTANDTEIDLYADEYAERVAKGE